MPSVGDIVNTVTIRGVADGVEATTAATKALGSAFDAAASAAQSSASDISGAFDGIQKSIGGAGTAGSTGLSFLSTIGLGAAASVAGLSLFLDWVQKTNKGLADMGNAAVQANLDMHDFQTLQFAAGTTGVSTDAFAKGAAAMATNLDEASRKENDLSKLLDANNIKFKDGNKLIVDMNGLWDIARDLISRAATEQQKIKMADMIGAGKELVPLLSEGAAAFSAQRSEAEKLGLVIDDDIIARAKTFEDEWQKSSTVFSTWMKAQLASLIPVIDDLIGKAQGLVAAVTNAVSAGINRSPSDPGQSSNEARAAAIMALIKDNDTLEQRASAVMLAFKALTGTLDDNTKALLDNNIATIGSAKMWNDIAAGMEQAAAAGARVVNVPMPPTRPASKLPPEDDNSKTNAWDRETDRIARHAAQLNADSLSVGQSIAVHDQLRAEFQLLDANRKADLGVTDEQIAKYTQLRGTMSSEQALTAAGIELNADQKDSFDKLTAAISAASKAAEEAKVQSNISFGRQTSLLTPEDAAIATQLKGLYGNDVPAALASSQAAALRFNDAMKTTSTTIQNDFSTALVDIMTNTKATGDVWRTFGLQVITAIDQMIVKILIMQPIMATLQKTMGGYSGGFNFLNLLGIGGASSVLAAANSSATGAAASDVAYAFSAGGMVGIEGKRTYVHPAYFENAPRFDMGGMISDGGVPIIAHPGERVLNRAQTAAYNSGGGASIHMGDIHIDASGADPAVVARLQSTLTEFRKNQYADTMKIINDASGRGWRPHP